MVDFHWKNEANWRRSEIYLIRSYADSLLKLVKSMYMYVTNVHVVLYGPWAVGKLHWYNCGIALKNFSISSIMFQLQLIVLENNIL